MTTKDMNAAIWAIRPRERCETRHPRPDVHAVPRRQHGRDSAAVAWGDSVASAGGVRMTTIPGLRTTKYTYRANATEIHHALAPRQLAALEAETNHDRPTNQSRVRGRMRVTGAMIVSSPCSTWTDATALVRCTRATDPRHPPQRRRQRHAGHLRTASASLRRLGVRVRQWDARPADPREAGDRRRDRADDPRGVGMTAIPPRWSYGAAQVAVVIWAAGRSDRHVARIHGDCLEVLSTTLGKVDRVPTAIRMAWLIGPPGGPNLNGSVP